MIKLTMAVAGLGMMAAVSIPTASVEKQEAVYHAPQQKIQQVAPEQRYMQTVQSRVTRSQLIRACNNIKNPQMRRKCLSRAK